MSIQDQCPPKKNCFFYFRYEMRIEFIPYIEEQIEHFIDLCEQQLHLPALRDSILIVLQKRIADIDRFFNKNYNDYRAQQVLRSRRMLTEFRKKNEAYFFKKTPTVENVKDKIKVSSGGAEKGDKKKEESPLREIGKEMFSKQKKIDKDKNSWQKIPPNKIIQVRNSSSNTKQQKNQPISPHISRKSELQQPKTMPRNNEQKSMSRVSSTTSDHIKIRSNSPKIGPKKETNTRKLTKEEYIAHLRQKKSQI